jgi:hypothetical protein
MTEVGTSGIIQTNSLKQEEVATIMEVACTSETSVNFYRTAGVYHLENNHLHTRRCEISNPTGTSCICSLDKRVVHLCPIIRL